MLTRCSFLLMLLAGLPLAAAAQTPAMNHLRGQLRLARTDTARARLLLALGNEVESDDSTIFYCRKALALANRARPGASPAGQRWWLRRQAGAWRRMGETYHYLQQTDSTAACLQRSAHTWQTLGNGEEQLAVLSDLFSVCNTANDHRQALGALQQGLDVIDKLAPSGATARPVAGFLTDASFYYYLQHDYAAARRYGLQGLRRLALAHDSLGMVTVLTALSVAEQELQQPALAEQHARCAARLAAQGVVVTEQALAEDILGRVLVKHNKLAEARQTFGQMLGHAQHEQGPPMVVAKALVNIADVEQRLGHAAVALPYAQEAEKTQAPLHILVLKRDLAQVQAAIYQDLGQPAKALAYYKAYIAARDSTSTEATRRATLMQRLTYQSQLTEARLRAARQRAEEEVSRQKLVQRLGLGAGLTLLLLLAGLYRWQRARQHTAKVLEARRLADLQELDRLKTTFFTNISHEFRTPLTLILGPAEVLATHESLPPALRDHGQLVRRNAHKLLRLTNQLLDLSKLEAGALRLVPTPGDAAQATRQAVGAFASLAEANGVALTQEVPAAPLPLVFDAAKLEEMLDNLLANALRLTPAGGQVRVTVAATAPTAAAPLGGVAWTVADTGPGISPEDLPRLFERFYQAASPADGRPAHTGTGLGLALVRELAALHGGIIAAESSPGAGATFRLWLPLGLLAVPAETIVGAWPAAGLGDGWPEAEAAPSGPTLTPEMLVADPDDAAPLVLLIEDNADVRAFVRATLAPAGYRLLEAPAGASGLALARAEVPDLVLSDVMMPGLDGYQVCAALKADPATSHIPVVLLTAKASPDDKLAGLETGADAYLAKPFNPRELQAQVRNLLALRQSVQARFGWATVAPVETTTTEAPASGDAPSATAPHNPLTDPAALAALPLPERRFLEKVAALLEARLADEGFGVDQLSEALAMSRTQVHRKFKALTGQTPGECLRLSRLYHALALLQTQPLTVAEVAYRVGYGSPSHFSTAFSRQFGFAPSAAARQG